jgi:hypothetical protein
MGGIAGPLSGSRPHVRLFFSVQQQPKETHTHVQTLSRWSCRWLERCPPQYYITSETFVVKAK